MAVINRTGESLRSRVFVGDRIGQLQDYESHVTNFAERWRTEVLDGSANMSDRRQAATRLVEGATKNQFHTVEQLMRDTDPDYNVSRHLLADSMYLAMRDGGDGLLNVALTGSVSDIERVTPNFIHALAREVRNRCIITNLDIGAVLDQVDSYAWDDIPPSAEDMVEGLTAAERQLRVLGATITKSSKDRDQWEVALRYVKARLSLARAESRNSDFGGAGHTDSLDVGGGGYMEAMHHLEVKTARENMELWVGALVASTPYRMSDEAMQKFFLAPEYVTDIPEFQGKDGKDRWQRLISAANAANNWAALRVGGQWRELDEVFSVATDLKTITQIKFNELMNMKIGGRKVVLEAASMMYKELLMEDGEFPNKAAFAVRFKDTESVKRALSRKEEYIGDIAQRLIKSGSFTAGETEVAKVVAATAWHLFMDFTMVDRADMSRSNNVAAIDGMRCKIFSPGVKVDAKLGITRANHDPSSDQDFGNKFFFWARNLLKLGNRYGKHGETFQQELLEDLANEEVAVLPRYLVLSYQEMTLVTVKDVNGDTHEESMAKVLCEFDPSQVEEIALTRSQDDCFAGEYLRDVISAAIKNGKRLLNDEKARLDLRGGIPGIKETIGKFCNDIGDLVNKGGTGRGKYLGGNNWERESVSIMGPIYRDAKVVARILLGMDPSSAFPLHPKLRMTPAPFDPAAGRRGNLNYHDYVNQLAGLMFGVGWDDKAMKEALIRELDAEVIAPMGIAAGLFGSFNEGKSDNKRNAEILRYEMASRK